MHLKKLRLFNFKNYAQAQLEFEANIQCFVGKNGSGKTNLLDAIYYLSFTRSAVNATDQQNIRFGADHFSIQGEFLKDDRLHEVTCFFQSGQKKIISEDRQEYARFSRHLGKYPVVLVAPNDIELIWNGSELRRRFFDNLLSQISADYLENLIAYTHHLKQRNSLLRIFSERGSESIDHDMLEVYDHQLAATGNQIHIKRRELVQEFNPLFEAHYKFLVDHSAEQVRIQYRSELETADFAEALKKNLARDILLQRTGFGIHRDDFLFFLNGGELKRFGSQGQQKSFLIGLKLTEFQILARDKHIKPLLLLDDIFDKLDDDRIRKLMLLVADGSFGQLLITDARARRSKEIVNETGLKPEFFEIENGMARRN